MFCWLNPYLCWLKPSFCWLKSKPHFLLVKSLFPLVKTPFSGGYLPRQVGKDSYCGLVQCSPVIQVIGIPPALYKWGLLHIIANWFVFLIGFTYHNPHSQSLTDTSPKRICLLRLLPIINFE